MTKNWQLSLWQSEPNALVGGLSGEGPSGACSAFADHFRSFYRSKMISEIRAERPGSPQKMHDQVHDVSFGTRLRLLRQGTAWQGDPCNEPTPSQIW
jgi:hypothetical protein